jgi:hypothetical protein
MDMPEGPWVHHSLAGSLVADASLRRRIHLLVQLSTGFFIAVPYLALFVLVVQIGVCGLELS